MKRPPEQHVASGDQLLEGRRRSVGLWELQLGSGRGQCASAAPGGLNSLLVLQLCPPRNITNPPLCAACWLLPDCFSQCYKATSAQPQWLKWRREAPGSSPRSHLCLQGSGLRRWIEFRMSDFRTDNSNIHNCTLVKGHSIEPPSAQLCVESDKQLAVLSDFSHCETPWSAAVCVMLPGRCVCQRS